MDGQASDVFQLFRTFKRKRVKIEDGEVVLKAVIEKEWLDSEQSKSEDDDISSSSSEIVLKPQQIQVID